MTQDQAIDPIPEETADPSATEAALRQRLAELEESVRKKLIQADLRVHALRAGMIDLDGLRLVEASHLSINDRDEVDGAEALMRELRQAKPWLFAPASTSSTAVPPAAQAPRPKLATEMSEVEWRAARTELLRRDG